MSRPAPAATLADRATAAGAAPTGRGRPRGVRRRSGAVAGVVAVLAFTWLHDLLISDIWAMLPIMAAAGAACGLSLASSYAVLARRPSLAGWLVHNAAFVALFALLGAVSVVVFEPVTTLAAVLDAGGPVDELMGRALPLAAATTVVAAALLALAHRAGSAGLRSALVACTVLMLFLGMNVATIGLVDIPTDSLYLVGELLGLIAGLGATHAVVFAALEWRALRPRRRADRGAERGTAPPGRVSRAASPP